jgi:hypothetical protein
MRYTDYTVRLKEMVAGGAVGEVVSVQHLGPVRAGHTGWPVDVFTTAPGGKHGVRRRRASAAMTMTAFTEMRNRQTRIFGTRGELTGDGTMIDV